jgi:hypothetical protein
LLQQGYCQVTSQIDRLNPAQFAEAMRSHAPLPIARPKSTENVLRISLTARPAILTF